MAATLDHLKSLGHRFIIYFRPDTEVSTGVHRSHALRTYFERELGLQAREFLTSSMSTTLGRAPVHGRGACLLGKGKECRIFYDLPTHPSAHDYSGSSHNI